MLTHYCVLCLTLGLGILCSVSCEQPGLGGSDIARGGAEGKDSLLAHALCHMYAIASLFEVTLSGLVARIVARRCATCATLCGRCADAGRDVVPEAARMLHDVARMLRALRG